MGGSGGGYFSGRVDPSDLSRRTRQAEEAAQTDEFEAEVSNFLDSELAQYNDRDVDGIQAVLQTVKDEIGAEMEIAVALSMLMISDLPSFFDFANPLLENDGISNGVSRFTPEDLWQIVVVR